MVWSSPRGIPNPLYKLECTLFHKSVALSSLIEILPRPSQINPLFNIMYTMKRLGILVTLQFFIQLGNTIIYPQVRRDVNIIDDYHGTKIPDPYQWLEDLDYPETKEFIEDQRQLTDTYLGRISLRSEIQNRITKLINYPKWSTIELSNEKYFYFHNSGLQNHDIFYVQDTPDSEPRILVDPNTLSSDGSVSMAYYRAISPDSILFVYSLSESGSDWITGRFVNTTNGENIQDLIDFIKWPEFSWSGNSKGVFYSRFPIDGDGKPINTNPGIYYHLLGTAQSEDTFIIDNPEHPDWFLMAEVSVDGKYLLVKPQPDFQTNAVKIATLDGGTVTSDFKTIFDVDELSRLIYVTNTESGFIFLTNLDAPNFKLIKIDIETNTRENIFPETESILKWAAAFDSNKIIMCHFVHVKHSLSVLDLNTGAVENIPIPAGIISGYSISKFNTELFFKFENLITPGIVYKCSTNEFGRIECIVQLEMKLDPDSGVELSEFETKQVEYASKDEEIIRMYIAHRKNMKYDGTAPTLLFGYGGFNVDQLPVFSPYNLAFMDYFNGVYASPNIRGGGEYGEPWHKAGMVFNKQNSFDDFQSAAEYLINEKYTQPSKIAIQGSSNGGLLVGACVNQRPDLFGIGLPDVGLMDMLRFQKFTGAFAWCSEYGCSDNQTQFEYLLKYSPLHNIGNEIKYPAMLISTADHDDRVVPSHSYKYAAEMQFKMKDNPNPVILRIEKDAGHNGGEKPTIKKIADYTDTFSFIAETLDQARSNSMKNCVCFAKIFVLFLTCVLIF